MSLLIKALDKAAESKHAESQANPTLHELSLEPISPKLATDSAARQTTQQAAATMFAAKNAPTKQTHYMVWVAALGLLLLTVMGVFFYQYIQSLAAPEVVMPRQANSLAAPAAIDEQAQVQRGAAVQAHPLQAPSLVPPTPAATTVPPEHMPVMPSSQSSAVLPQAPASLEPKQSTKQAKIPAAAFGEPVSLGGDQAVNVTKSQAVVMLNPKLNAAYQAYIAGNDALAQKSYRDVLREDEHNTDAMLGLATIATRQGRDTDAIDWYKKVLILEPKSSLAQAGLAAMTDQADPVASESRIKNLIAQQPESAHLHGVLGDFYAEQNQWASAQQAYFQAYHFEPNSADYAFNLAASLDQMGKPNLALPYYTKALELLNASHSANIDRAKLEARISQLQP